MKFKKLLTSIMSAAIVITSAGSVMANAEEVTEEKIYTLSELLDMSKEEFLQLDNAQKYYDEIAREAEKSNMNPSPEDYPDAIDSYVPLTRSFGNNISNGYYIPFETEKAIKSVIDVDGFTIKSPLIILNPNNSFADNNFFTTMYSVYVIDDEYTTDPQYFDEETNKSNETAILGISKIYYCLNQVTPLHFYGNSTKALASTDRTMVDANEDGIFNIMDASFIARSLASGKADELPETADYNADGEIDIRDAADIAQFMAARAAAQAEGWIE